MIKHTVDKLHCVESKICCKTSLFHTIYVPDAGMYASERIEVILLHLIIAFDNIYHKQLFS